MPTLGKTSPLVAALAAAKPPKSGHPRVVDKLDDETREAILDARRRGLAYTLIAETLTNAGQPISSGPVREFCRANGLT